MQFERFLQGMGGVMTPYYQDDYVTIYNADCRDVLQNIKNIDVTLTDPPYGINGGTGGTSKQRARGQYKGAFSIEDDTVEFIKKVASPVVKQCIKISHAVVLTPGNKNFCSYPQPDSLGCMWQPQGSGAQRWGWCDSQPIFYYGQSPYQGEKLLPCSFRVTKSDNCKNGHPCPKPLSFWSILLAKAVGEKYKTILDPFAGSGTTGRASKDLGLKSILIEINEEYCEIAAKRCSQEVFNFQNNS